VVEGNQAATDKQQAEVRDAVAASEGEGQQATAEEDASAEEISMEDVLGGGRKQPMSAESEAAADTAEARHAEV
jgi:hypothetical protein